VRNVISKQQGKSHAAARWPVFLGKIVGGFIAALTTAALVAPSPASARYIGSYTGPVFEWIVLDAETGQVLGEQNADVLTYPASLTKMMTLYLTFEALNQGRIRLDQRFYVSPFAASRAPSKLGLTPGDSVPVRDLILGIVTKSANDAAATLAEGLAGSEERFAQYMTWKARQLGMDHTWYQNASGLPNPDQRTTARDVARLALALYHQFPREYRYFATREFDFRGEVVHGHNHLLEWYQGADGIKTGFVNASGFNLAASAVRNGRRLIGVVMGGRSARTRDEQMASLLDQGFAILASGRAPAAAPAAPLVASGAQPAFPEPPAQPTWPQAPAAPVPAQAPAQPLPVQTAATPAPIAASTAPAPIPATATARSGSIGDVARAALRHLAPVAHAEAAQMPAEAAGSEDWGIQIGAFRAADAAEVAARHAVRVALLKGKPQQIMAPGRSDHPRLYRARLLHFTQKGATNACAELHRHGIACSVVRPAAVKVASS
jgi:D-alanyl-D-alanine carboxypeptidase